jgi:exonuclease III
VDIICFQETKLEAMSHSLVHSLWGHHHVDCCCMDSKGASCGVLIMWYKRVVEKDRRVCGGVHPGCYLMKSCRSIHLAFAGVYGPNSDRDRRHLWDELVGMLNWWNLPWCIEGDFNIT